MSSHQRAGGPPFLTSVVEITKLVGGEASALDDGVVISGFASLKGAVEGDLSFCTSSRHLAQLALTKASAILVPQDCPEVPGHLVLIRVKDPDEAFDVVMDEYGSPFAGFTPGIHPAAAVAATAKFDPAKVSIGACAVIEDGAVIGDGSEIGPGCFVGRDVRLGANTRLHANVSVQERCIISDRVILHSGVVVGADGFGYKFQNGRHRKVVQRGIVQIDSDVEIGANTTVDRARYDRTWIGEGTKIDNLVQIGHNVIIGKHCILVAGTAIAGSAEIGDYVVVAAQVGVAGHVKVGSQSTLGARCGVTKDLPAGGNYLGFPAIPAREERRRIAGVSRLSRLDFRVTQLERSLREAPAFPAGMAE